MTEATAGNPGVLESHFLFKEFDFSYLKIYILHVWGIQQTEGTVVVLRGLIHS